MIPIARTHAEVGLIPDADTIRGTERDRLRALVEGDLPRARHLHADDYQLISPHGDVLSKSE
jgi:hypothetical protein